MVIFLLSIIPALLAGISIPFLLSPIISSELFDTFQATIFFKPIIISFSFGLIVYMYKMLTKMYCMNEENYR